jgi:hypothetical protein
MLLAGVLTAAWSSPAGSQERDNRRMAPAHCQQLVAEFSIGLRETRRRLERSSDRPDAERQQSAILARALERPSGSNDLSKLLACLAGQ